jgi:prepilin-type N-terminal cleavage/methylation domain-containing protein
MRRESAGGFTLVEMMIVVVIFGILASLAVVGMRKYIQHSKTAEAPQMIGAIKAGQEAYFDETFRYLDVSGGDLDNRYPLDASWDMKVQWGGGDATLRDGFATLGVSSAQAVQYRYSTAAGGPGDSPSFGAGVTAAEYNFPSSTTVQWYVVKAIADLDQDGTYGVYLGSNFSNLIYAKNDDE